MASEPTDDFDKRLADARKRGEDHRLRKRSASSSGNAMGAGFRIATELVGGVLIGALIGWALDLWLGTSPGLLFLFLMLGFAAGVQNVIRATRKLDRDLSSGGLGQDLPDDDDKS